MRILLICLLLFVPLVGTGCSLELQKIEGQVSVAGNAPLTYVRIIDADHQEYRLVGEQVDRIRQDWQGRKVLLKGQVVKDALGPGMPAEFRVETILPR